VTSIESDTEVAARLEFEETQRSEGWRLLRAALRMQRRNLLLGALVGILWASFKVAVPQMAERVIDHAIQSYGGAGVCQDTPLASMYAGIRTLRIVDGPDEVHIRDIARLEIKSYLS
jgi:alkylation response protein AidB-like acyl-CoA dehydrogenase